MLPVILEAPDNMDKLFTVTDKYKLELNENLKFDKDIKNKLAVSLQKYIIYLKNYPEGSKTPAQCQEWIDAMLSRMVQLGTLYKSQETWVFEPRDESVYPKDHWTK